jgi:hypothetical protein
VTGWGRGADDDGDWLYQDRAVDLARRSVRRPRSHLSFNIIGAHFSALPTCVTNGAVPGHASVTGMWLGAIRVRSQSCRRPVMAVQAQRMTPPMAPAPSLAFSAQVRALAREVHIRFRPWAIRLAGKHFDQRGQAWIEVSLIRVTTEIVDWRPRFPTASLTFTRH